MSYLSRSLRTLGVLGFATAASSGFGAAYVGSAYEGFDYTAGATMDNTFGGGTGWTTNWGVNVVTAPTNTVLNASGSRAVTTGGLAYSNPAYPTGAGNAVLVSGAGQIGRALGQTVDTGTFYFSYLTRKTIDQVRTVNFAFFSGGSERLTVGQIANNVNTRDEDGVWQSGAGANLGNFATLISNSQNTPVAAPADPTSFNGVYLADLPTHFDVDTTFLLVGKVQFNTSGVADTFTLYINPGNLADDSGLIPYMTIDHNDFGAIDGFRLFAGGTSGGFTASAQIIDEIRFGSTYNAVTGVAAVPEPSTYAALAGACGLLIASIHRRRLG